MDHLCLIALGSNLASAENSPKDTVMAAFAQLAKIGGALHLTSKLYQTPAFPKGAGPDYVNAAASLRWSGSAQDLMAELHLIEEAHKRQRIQRWGQRTLDLDLIAVGHQIAPDTETWRAWADLPPERQIRETPGQLILPHPRLQDRAFVLVPLAEIAPDWRHPVFNRSIRQMRDDLPEADLAEVKTL